MRRSSCSTKPPRRSIPNPSAMCRKRWPSFARGAPRSSSPTGCRRSCTPTPFSSSRTVLWSNPAATTSCYARAAAMPCSTGCSFASSRRPPLCRPLRLKTKTEDGMGCRKRNKDIRRIITPPMCPREANLDSIPQWLNDVIRAKSISERQRYQSWLTLNCSQSDGSQQETSRAFVQIEYLNSPNTLIQVASPLREKVCIEGNKDGELYLFDRHCIRSLRISSFHAASSEEYLHTFSRRDRRSVWSDCDYSGALYFSCSLGFGASVLCARSSSIFPFPKCERCFGLYLRAGAWNLAQLHHQTSAERGPSQRSDHRRHWSGGPVYSRFSGERRRRIN